MSPVWVPSDAVIAIHQALLQEHGWLIGPARPDGLEAALVPPRQLHHYAQPKPSVARLAAAYGFALAKGHCSADGKQRLALSIIDEFLQGNGSELAATSRTGSSTPQTASVGAP